MSRYQMITGRPGRCEATDYYFTYIDRVDTDDICAYLNAQSKDTIGLLNTVSDDDSVRRYAPGKWSFRELVAHVNDAERLFAFRALWFARGFETPLPSFDQNIAIASSGADLRSWGSHIEEFRAVRAATLALFGGLPPDAWLRQGSASGNVFTVRALAFLIGGHVAHHQAILNERYLSADARRPGNFRRAGNAAGPRGPALRR